MKYIISIILLLSSIVAKSYECKIVSITPQGQTIKIDALPKGNKEVFQSNQIITIGDKQKVKIRIPSFPKPQTREIIGSEFIRKGYNTVEDYITKKRGTKRPKGIVEDTKMRHSKFVSGFNETRIALIIGNGDYEKEPLPLCIADAYDVANKLDTLGFDSFTYYDLTFEEINSVIGAFCDTILTKKYDVALVYYSGHGAQIENQQCLVPIDFTDNSKYFPLGNISIRLSRTNATDKLIFLDACRSPKYNDNIESSIDNDKANDAFIVFATDANRTADAGYDEDANSPFTSAFLDVVGKPHNTVSDAVTEMSEILERQSNPKPVIRSVGTKFTFYNEKDLKQAAQAATKAHDLYYSKGRPIEALGLLYENFPHNQRDLSNPYSVEVENELRSILNDTIAPYRFLRGHHNVVNAAYFSKDDKYLLSVGADSVLIVWDIENGQKLHELNGVVLSCVSSDLTYMVIEKSPTRFEVYETVGCRLLSTIEWQDNLDNKRKSRCEIGFTRDDKHVFTFQTENGLTIWDVKSGESIAHTDKYYSEYWCGLSSNGELLAYIDKDQNQNILELWDIKNNKLVFSSPVNTEEISQSVFTDNDKFIITVDRSGNIIKWNLNGKIMDSFNVGLELLGSIQFDKPNLNMTVYYSDGYVLVSLANKKIIKTFEDTYAPFFFNDKIVSIRRGDYNLWETWSVESGNFIASFGPYIKNEVTAIDEKAGKALITLFNGKVTLFDMSGGKAIAELHQQFNYLYGALFSTASRFIASVANNGEIIIWRIDIDDNFSNNKTINLSSTPTRDSQMFIENNYLIVDTRSDNIDIFNLNNYNRTQIKCTSGRFVVAHNLIFSVQDERIVIYDTNKNKVSNEINIADVNNLFLSEDKTRVAIIKSDGTLYIYNIEKKQLVEYASPFENNNPYYSKLKFSHDNSLFVAYDISRSSISKDGQIVVWRTSDNKTYKQIKVDELIYSLDVSPINNYIIAQGLHKCKLFNPASDYAEVSLEPKGEGYACAFSHPRKDVLFTITYDSYDNVHVRNIADITVVSHTLSGGLYNIRYGGFSDDGKILYLVGFMGNDNNPSGYKLMAWNSEDMTTIFERTFDDTNTFVGEYNGYLVFYSNNENGDQLTLEMVNVDKMLIPASDILSKVKDILK